jgi:nucleoid DNA-binding protein
VRELKTEGSIRLSGLGIFHQRKTELRIGRNPATGAQIKIPARMQLQFTPAKALKDEVLGDG